MYGKPMPVLYTSYGVVKSEYVPLPRQRLGDPALRQAEVSEGTKNIPYILHFLPWTLLATYWAPADAQPQTIFKKMYWCAFPNVPLVRSLDL